MFPQVASVASVCAKFLVADITSKRHLFSMRRHMTGQFCFGDKTLLTLVALIWPHTCEIRAGKKRESTSLIICKKVELHKQKPKKKTQPNVFLFYPLSCLINKDVFQIFYIVVDILLSKPFQINYPANFEAVGQKNSNDRS